MTAMVVFLGSAIAVRALDVTGKVVDKRFSPLAGVNVCIAASSTCTNTAANGTFHLTGSSTGIPLRSAIPSRATAGFYRVTADGRRMNEEASGSYFGFNLDRASSAGLAKAAAVSIDCSKQGYAPTAYALAADAVKDAVIMMGGAGENVSALFTGTSLTGWKAIPAGSWVIKDTALASTGAGRGVLYTAGDYLDYRIIFSVRQISGNHWPCVLYFCQRPPEGQNGLDALGGVQWQAPGVYTWDYRPGKNNDGLAYYTKLTNTPLDRNRWAQCEIIVRGSQGKARMGCCQVTPGVPCKAKEMLRFQDPSAGRKGPFALQMHNGGILDE
jgi:hypothetical protein